MDDTPGRVNRPADRPGQRGDDVAGHSAENTRGYAESQPDEVDPRTREIRHEIEETRGEMSETIDAIQEKLNPRNIMADATDRVKNAATERVRDMADTASQTAQQAMDYTRERASDVAQGARRNAIPLALIGVGAAWLLTNRSRRSNYDEDWRYRRDYGDYGRTSPRDESLYGGGSASRYAEGTASRAREYASDTADSVRRMTRRRQNQLQRMVQENPLLVGAGALMLGAAFGLAVPETDAENELMGPARDNMVDRARDMARDAASQVQEAASTVTEAAKKITGKQQP
jgi:hypothetical protein